MALLAIPSVRLAPAVRVARRGGAVARRRISCVTRASFEDQPGDDTAGPAASTKTEVRRTTTSDVPAETETEAYVESDEEIRERRAVGALVRWCVERGATGSGLSVRLPDDTNKGRGLEASRDIEVDEAVLALPLQMGICDSQEGHPPESWETMSNAPWGVRLACRLLQERAKGDASEYAPYLALVPHSVPGSPLHWTDDEVLGLQYPPAVTEAKEMRDAVRKWHGILLETCPTSLGGSEADAHADYEAFASAVSVVHSRTYGVASGASGEGYFRALLPLADLLNHGGDEYGPRDGRAEQAREHSRWPPSVSVDNIAWSALDDSGTVEFAATKRIDAGVEALMSYGERTNDHFLMYYGFVPNRNPHDDVVVFQDVDHALSWHMVFHPELWDADASSEDAFADETVADVREAAARSAVKATERALAQTSDGALVASEPRLKVLPGGRVDARLVSLFAAAYAGTDSGVEGGKEVLDVDIQSAHRDVSRRCAELLRQMPTDLKDDYGILKPTSGVALSDAVRACVSYRAHKKEVLVDAIRTLGGGDTALPEAYR
jgi:hypothetical protein